MKMYGVPILLLTAASLAAAHPLPHVHSHSGECMEMKSPMSTDKDQWPVPLFKCIRDVYQSKGEFMAWRACHKQANSYMMDFFIGDRIENPKINSLEEVKAKGAMFFAKCMVDSLQLEASDGSLDMQRVMTNAINWRSSDLSALIEIQTWMIICTKNNTGTIAAEQLLDLKSCMDGKVSDYCDNQQMLVQDYLERGEGESACANISIDSAASEVTQKYGECLEELETQAVKDRKAEKESTEDELLSSNGLIAQKTVQGYFCLAKKMNWISLDSGFDFAAHRDFVANFSGWEEAPEALISLMSGMIDCEAEFNGEPFAQMDQYKSCLQPLLANICGFNSGATNFLFPSLTHNTQRAALKYLKKMTVMDDDSMEDYYDDFEDDDDEGGADDDFYEDENNESDSDDEDYSYENAAMVDDGLFVKGPGMVTNEGDADAILMDDDVDEDRETIMKSHEDDAEDLMARMKHKNSRSEESSDEDSSDDTKESKEATEASESTELTNKDSEETTEATSYESEELTTTDQLP